MISAKESGNQFTSWIPTESEIKLTNIYSLMTKLKIGSYPEFHAWSVNAKEDFWELMIEELGIVFKSKYKKIVDLSRGVELPQWLVGASLNIADSCFKNKPDDKAIIYQEEGCAIKSITYGELNNLSNRVANALVDLGFNKGDAIAVDMPMTIEAVAIYLGIVKAGCAVVSIADSFASEEIATRLKIAKAKGIFTQDFILRNDKQIPLYKKVIDANAPRAIVVISKEIASASPRNDGLRHCEEGRSPDEAISSAVVGVSGKQSLLREGDILWNNFLSSNEKFISVPSTPSDYMNILFSSGTTGDPKAIPWSHSTPIKCAVDGYLHHDIKPGDIVAWPTNLGWMMGPWLIYATLINRGTIALYYGLPVARGFGEFIEKAKITMLGIVPSIVKTWRETKCMEGLHWSSIKCFSSTGESSNAGDYSYLMSLANNKPVIEYCGGTEIGGGYITGTLVQPTYPAAFSTASCGLDFVILDEEGNPSDCGELFIIPPSIGLSTELLNQDHHDIYFAGVPKGPNGEILRRHGDQIERLPNGYYKALGRADDTMNLSGIKVSSVEIERVVSKVSGVKETAAIALNPREGGPSLLVIYAVLNKGLVQGAEELRGKMQQAIRAELNPLFKIEKVVVIDSLPRTASNKITRRVLRERFPLSGE